MSTDIDHIWPGGIPRVGQVAERSRTVNAKDIERFTEISGDRNPLHYDEAVAKASRFGPATPLPAAPRYSRFEPINPSRSSRRASRETTERSSSTATRCVTRCRSRKARPRKVRHDQPHSTHNRAVLHLDELKLEVLHGAGEAERRAFADAADLPPIPEDEDQGPASETIGNVDGCATVAQLNQGTSTPFENERLARVTLESGLFVLSELAVKRKADESGPVSPVGGVAVVGLPLPSRVMRAR